MRNALLDVRTLLEDSPAPLSVTQMVERLDGEHERAAVEHLLEHFRHEGLVRRNGDGQWDWSAKPA
ncbi:MAG TPA: hypothetical protein VMA83_05250 [Solirubrobacteraceae bacterium]|nr:hypothetical protein [Solirubrobacteraceae bacterium]